MATHLLGVNPIKKYDNTTAVMNRGQVGCDWMPYELSLNVLGMSKNPTTCTFVCGTYLTSTKKFSLGNRAVKFMNRSNFFIHDSKDSIVKEIKRLGSLPENYVKFDLWYSKILVTGARPFYVKDPRYDHNWFYLRMTDAMINNIYRFLSLVDGQLWIDYTNWTITEKYTTFKGVNNATLPGEVWTS